MNKYIILYFHILNMFKIDYRIGMHKYGGNIICIHLFLSISFYIFLKSITIKIRTDNYSYNLYL